jgi:hypothetical protein
VKRRHAFVLVLALFACRREPDVVAGLAAHLPANAAVIAGLDVDRLRSTPLLPKLPESFREASYVLAAYDPPQFVTASRVKDRIVATHEKTGPPPDLMRHAGKEPIWIVARGDTVLPLTGNLANVNRLLQQTLYTRITARIESNIEFVAEGVCANATAAEHLEQNIRAIATLAKLPLEVRREGVTVRVTGSAAIETIAGLF